MKNKFIALKKLPLVILCVLLPWVAAPGCAVVSSHTMSTTNFVDRAIVKDRAWSWPLLPVLVPTTIVTLTVDNFIVAPIAHLPSAALDAWTILTEPVDGAGWYAEAGFAPFRLLLSPVVFVGSWIVRGFFAAKPRSNAAWAWPEWGYQYRRDKDGNLLGPPLVDPLKSRPLKGAGGKKPVPPAAAEPPEEKRK